MRLPALAAPLLAAALAVVPQARAAPAPEEVRALRQEIAALQVDRALNLTPAQARVLLPLLQDAAARVKASREQREAASPALVEALRRARDELRSTGSVSDATRKALAEARGPRPFPREQLQGLRTRIRAILSPEQAAALAAANLWIAPPGGPDAFGGSAGGPRASGEEGRRGRGPMRRLLVARTLVSDPFLALLQARAG